jgi:predicted ATPase/DNA-binding SARP family transcriptional activator
VGEAEEGLQVELRVLGPLEVVGPAGVVPIRARMLRLLLLALIAHRQGPRAADSLIDDLWGETPPASAAKLLQVYVSQLRRLLPAGVRIATHTAGYVLEVDADTIDAVRFEALVAAGRTAMARANAPLAAATFRRALALWRGPAYADAMYDDALRPEAERLEALRDLALEDRLEAELQVGRHAEALSELRVLLDDEPSRERLARLAMLAAYRTSGSRAALEIYERTRTALATELHEQPGPELASLRDQIVRRDPALAAPAPQPTTPRLPTPPDSLIGREKELADLVALLRRPGVRLVSLTGAGGSGKSRLALELARASAEDYANGAALVEVASLADPSLVLPTIARVLDVDPGADAFEALAGALADRETLLVVDNLEHIREAARDLTRLLSAAPGLRIVVTSRVVLHVSGEHVYAVAPLQESAAVALFRERAAAADASFALRAEDGAVVEEICRRLDHLPLAIELAAARVRTLGLGGVRVRLASRLALLSGGPRDLPARQQTLRETLAWSVNLLEPATADVLARLAVFPASCSMAAASAVAGADERAMEELIDHSLVHPHDLDGERRYRLLETVREHAYEALGSRRAETEAALVAWVRTLVREADFNVSGRAISTERMDLAEHEIDTIRDALRHAASDDDPTAELELATGMWRFWWIRGYVAEGLATLEDLLARRGLVPTRDGVRAIRAAASLAWTMDRIDRAQRLAAEALAAASGLGDAFEISSTLNLLALIAQAEDRHADSVELLGRAIVLAEAENLETGALKLNLGISHLALGDVDTARRVFQELLALREPGGPSEGLGFARINLGETELQAGNLADAEVHYRAAAESFSRIGFHSRHANALQGLAAVEARTGRVDAAARHLGFAAGLLGPTGWGREGSDPADEAEAAARRGLGDEEFERCFAAGRAEAAGGPPRS